MLAPALLALGFATLIWITAFVLQIYTLAAVHGFAQTAGVDPELKPGIVHRFLADAYARVDTLRPVVAAAIGGAALLAVAGAVLWARAGRVASHATLVIAAVLCALGVASFAATRAHAYDAAHLVSVEPGTGILDRESLGLAPRTKSCDAQASSMPVVTFADAVKLDRRVVGPEELRDQIITLRNNLLLLHPDAKRSRFRVLVVAPLETATERMLPFLRAIARADLSSIDAVSVRPDVLVTRTLGVLERPIVCIHPVALTGEWMPGSLSTWGALIGDPRQ